MPEARGRSLRALKIAALSVFAYYVVVCAAVAAFQRKIIYHPPVFDSEVANRLALKAGLERWKSPSGEAIGWKRLSSKKLARQVLITYGNGSYAIGCARYVDALQSVGAFDVFVLEYPGYGDRVGAPTQDSLFRSADEALSLLGKDDSVYLVGESLGSGVASYLAGKHPDRIAGVVLLSPFNRLIDVAQADMPLFPVRMLLVDQFPSQDYLRQYHGPIGVMVDGMDQVVPAELGMRLYNAYAGPKRLWKNPHGQHIAIEEPSADFWGQVVGFWRTKPG